jgi:hypothetical protein
MVVDRMNDNPDTPENILPSAVGAGATAEVAGMNKDDPVGYGRPPKHSRFKPGQSGNLRGRPPGVKVTVTENGRSRRVPRLEAILLRAAGEASRGDARALRLLLQLTERYGESAQSAAERETTAAEDIAILRRYLPDFGDPSPVEIDPETDADVRHER